LHEWASPSRFLAFAARFPYVFFDQFGVLHNGRAPYPGAIGALRALRSLGAKIVVLSNSGKSGRRNAERMERIGFDRELYDHFVTSGDVAKSLLTGNNPPIALGAASRCFTISASEEREFAEDLGLTGVEEPAEADLVLISGSQTDRVSLDQYAALLAPAAMRGVPALCTNPDKLMLKGEAVLPGAGAIASQYEKQGGPVTWVGKPFPEIYRYAQALVGAPDPSRILCVGDSVEHDVAGAHRFGAAAALVRTGILADLSEAELARECAAHGAIPDVILSDLR
jgi:HAD superfamily hydrolase (TIGR01459 family)